MLEWPYSGTDSACEVGAMQAAMQASMMRRLEAYGTCNLPGNHLEQEDSTTKSLLRCAIICFVGNALASFFSWRHMECHSNYALRNSMMPSLEHARCAFLASRKCTGSSLWLELLPELGQGGAVAQGVDLVLLLSQFLVHAGQMLTHCAQLVLVTAHR